MKPLNKTPVTQRCAMRRLQWVPCLFLVIGGYSLPVTSRADWQWSAITDIGPSNSFYASPQIEMDAVSGSAVATWVLQGQGQYSGVPHTLQAAVNHKGRWNYRGSLSLNNTPPALGVEPQIALSRNAAASIMWSDSKPGNDYQAEQVAINKSNGSWKTLKSLAVGSPETEATPQLAIARDNAGTLMAVWADQQADDRYVLRSSVFKNKKWGGSVFLAEGRNNPEPKVISTHGNDFTVVWMQSDAQYPGYLQTARYRNGRWGTASNITQPTSDVDARVALTVDGAGTVTAVWYHEIPGASQGAEGNLIQSAYRPKKGSWSTPTQLGIAGKIGTYPNIASNRRGKLTAAWAAEGRIMKIVQYDGQKWGSTMSLGNTKNMVPKPYIAMDDKGRATVVWSVVENIKGSDWTKWSWSAQFTHHDGSSWSEPVQLCNQCRQARIAGDTKGNVLAIWASLNGALQSTRGYDQPK